CITCVLALCIAPYVDIPVTVLKSLQTAILLMVLLLAASLSLASLLFFRLVVFRQVERISHITLIRSLLLPIETNCVQQC
ncbi:MAG: hypothetical protein WA419_10935, partial [Silvibacterium sp.]